MKNARWVTGLTSLMGRMSSRVGVLGLRLASSSTSCLDTAGYMAAVRGRGLAPETAKDEAVCRCFECVQQSAISDDRLPAVLSHIVVVRRDHA